MANRTIDYLYSDEHYADALTILEFWEFDQDMRNVVAADPALNDALNQVLMIQVLAALWMDADIETIYGLFDRTLTAYHDYLMTRPTD